MSTPPRGPSASPAAAGSPFVDLSRRFLDFLGPDGIGSEWEQQDYGVAGTEPRWVLLPASVDECAETLRLCSAHGLGVVPAGFGQRLQQGRSPERLDVIVSTSRMNRVVEHAAADMTVVVEAGASLADVNRALGEAGQWLPFDPPFPERTSTGGLLAANVSGPSRHAFGTARESLIGMRAVLADGSVITSGGRVVKNVAGYDLHRLLVGSFGTLAVIVEANFKCRPVPERTQAVELEGDLRPLLEVARRIAGSTLQPVFLELLFATGAPSRLIIGFAGVAEQIEWATNRAAEIARCSIGVSDPRAVHGEIETIATPAAQTLVLRGGVPPRALADWLEAVLESSAPIRGHAHAAIGVTRLRIDGVGPADAGEAVERVRHAALERRGHLVVESAPTGWVGDPWGPAPPGLHLMEGAKRAFDPGRILSPGRFVGGI